MKPGMCHLLYLSSSLCPLTLFLFVSLFSLFSLYSVFLSLLGEEGCEIENDYYWLLLTKPFWIGRIGLGVPFKIFTARLGLSVRISQIHFQKITFINLSLFFLSIYLSISLFRFDEKRYTSACIEPPVPKLFFAQLDALNDCLVIENLEQVSVVNENINLSQTGITMFLLQFRRKKFVKIQLFLLSCHL